VRRHWIPPGALLFAQVSHGLSWVLLAIAGFSFAWIHVVSLGWLTMGALGILIHIIPGFTGAQWRKPAIPRYLLVPFGFGIALFVFGWWFELLLAPGALLMAASFLAYYVVAVRTLANERDEGKTEAAIARALTINLTFFLIAALLGAMMAFSLTFGWASALVARLAPMHASLALFGWLTMLVFGVSARTVRPICGVKSRLPMHVFSGTAMSVGPVVAAAGIGFGNAPATYVGSTIIALGAIAYAIDLVDIVRRATNPHRPPQAFLIAGVVWLLAAIAIAFAGAFGIGFGWQAASIFVLLAGWIGQMFSAHMLHIGVRLVTTMIRGDEDETRPGILLDARLSWLAFALAQLAVAIVTAGLLSSTSDLVTAGAAAGFAAWIVLMCGIFVAAKRAKLPA
jgi:hypothetical protein